MARTNFCAAIASFLYFSITVQGQSRGDLAADSMVLSLTKSEILNIYEDFGISEALFPIWYDLLGLHRIEYYTPNGRGDSLTLASGLMTFPVDTICPFPLLNYSHGSLMYDEVLSEFKAKLFQHYIGVPFAANGYVSALPDFLGYGATPVDHPHPYVHAKSEATAVVDMLRATRTLCAANQIRLNDELFLLGYSQGGHVTMAAHREIQNLHADEFTVTASAPCSGPYDLSGILFDSIFHSQTYSNPFFIAFGTLFTSLFTKTCTPFALVSAKFWFDGLRTSCFVPTDEIAGNSAPQIFPNPFQDGITVRVPGNKPGTLHITDLLGRPVFEHDVFDTQQVCLPATLSPGTYLATLTVNGRTNLIKLVKN